MTTNERSLVNAFFSIFSATVVGQVISVQITPLLVCLLSFDQYGDYALALSVLSPLVVFANSGVTRGMWKYLPEADE